MRANIAISRNETAVLVTNKLIRNTYTLLSLTLLFSAMTCAISMGLGVGRGAGLVTSLAALGLLWFVLPKTAHSSAGLGVVFAITGLLGFGLGPVISSYLTLANGSQIVMTALGGTGAIFLGLSTYALTTKRDFSFMGGFLIVGMLVVLGAALLNIFLAVPALSLTISAVVVMLMSGLILYDTSRMVNGGETNYVLATISLYLNILNLFTSLLHLLGLSSAND